MGRAREPRENQTESGAGTAQETRSGIGSFSGVPWGTSAPAPILVGSSTGGTFSSFRLRLLGGVVAASVRGRNRSRACSAMHRQFVLVRWTIRSNLKRCATLVGSTAEPRNRWPLVTPSVLSWPHVFSPYHIGLSKLVARDREMSFFCASSKPMDVYFFLRALRARIGG